MGSLEASESLLAPESFLKPSGNLHATWTQITKNYIDSLAKNVSSAQALRRQKAHPKKRRSKNKRSKSEGVDEEDEEEDEEEDRKKQAHQPLRLQEIYVDNFSAQQVWEQINKVLQSTCAEVDRDARSQSLASRAEEKDELEGGEEDAHMSDDGDMSETSQHDMSDEESEDGDAGPGVNGMDEGKKQRPDEEDIDNEDGNDDEEEEEEEHARPSKTKASTPKPRVTKPDVHGLNDGFFNIDEFNSQSAYFEHKDDKGKDDDEDEDEEPINWEADPNLGAGAGEDDDEDDEDGDEDEDEEDEEGGLSLGMGNANDIMYADFFGPPDQVQKSDKQQDQQKGQKKKVQFAEPDGVRHSEDEDEEMADQEEEQERGDEDVGEQDVNEIRKLWDDEDESEERAANANDDGEYQSTHERQRMKILDDIRRLEAANVAKKDWLLSGEVEASSRPQNSLIEEDLDIERVGKPVVVVTNEISEGMEDMIRRRILNKEFDEVIRRQPNSSDLSREAKTPFVLPDTKPEQSLAELYENQYHKLSDPNYVDPRSDKLNKERAEISRLWRDLSSQLDILTSWHHRPAAPQLNVNVVKDAATIAMEDIRPDAAMGVDETRVLAPQEAYTPAVGTSAENRGEVVMKSGAPVAKEEMSREDKSRRRRKEKRRRAKEFHAKEVATQASAAHSKKAQTATEEKQVLSDLKKGDVKVIGKEGDLTNVTGQKVAAGRKFDSSKANYKL